MNEEGLLVQNISCKLSMASRVALLGANGAGKTTLLKLFVGELEQGEKKVHFPARTFCSLFEL